MKILKAVVDAGMVLVLLPIWIGFVVYDHAALYLAEKCGRE